MAAANWVKANVRQTIASALPMYNNMYTPAGASSKNTTKL
jgi:hypothetical protein